MLLMGVDLVTRSRHRGRRRGGGHHGRLADPAPRPARLRRHPGGRHPLAGAHRRRPRGRGPGGRGPQGAASRDRHPARDRGPGRELRHRPAATGGPPPRGPPAGADHVLPLEPPRPAPPVEVDAGQRRRAPAAGHPGAQPPTGLLRPGQRPGRHHHPPGLRPHGRGLRARLQRSPDRRRRAPDRDVPAAAGRHHERPGGDPGGRVRLPRHHQRSGRPHRGDVEGDPDHVAAGRGHRAARAPPPRRRGAPGHRRHGRSTSTSPGRSPARSTSPTTSRPACRCSSASCSASRSCC